MEPTEAGEGAPGEGGGRSRDAIQNTSAWTCPDGSLVKSILERGTGVDKPKEGSRCCVLAELDQEELVVGASPFQFALNRWAEVVLGEGDTPWDAAVDKCLETMLEQEACHVCVAPLDSLPELAFILRLASFSCAKDSWEMAFEEKWALALRDKELGTALFKEGNLFGAARRYSRALRLLLSLAGHEVPAEMAEERGAAQAALQSNLAACQLRLRQFENAAQNCTKVLAREPGSVKVLYRRGLAHAALNEFELARVDLREVLRLEPGNRAAQRELKQLAERVREQEAKMAQNMHKLFL